MNQRFLKYSNFLRIRPTIQRYHTPVSFSLFTLTKAHSYLPKFASKQRNLNKIGEIENNQEQTISPQIQEKEREIEFLKLKLNQCMKEKQKYWRQIMKLRKKVSDIEDQIQEIKAEHAEMKTHMKNSDAKMEAMIGEVKTQMKNSDAKIETIMKNQDTNIETIMKNSDAKIETMKKNQDAMQKNSDAKIETMQKNYDNMFGEMKRQAAETKIQLDKLFNVNQENDLEKIRREVIFQFLKEVRDMMNNNDPSFAKLPYKQQQQRIIAENSFITPQQWEFIYSFKIKVNQQFHPSLSKVSPTYYNKIEDIQESNMSNWNNNDQQEQISLNEAKIIFYCMKKAIFSKKKFIYDDLKKQYEDNKMDYQQQLLNQQQLLQENE